MIQSAALTESHFSPAAPPPNPHPPLPAGAASAPNEPLCGSRILRPAAFLERLHRAAGSEPASVALLLVDIADFHAVNSARGFAAGDVLLQLIGERLAAQLRGQEVLARLGGDEFAVLLLDIFDPASAIAAAREVLSALRQPISFQGEPIDVAARAGLAQCRAQTCDVRSLLHRARAALGIAKRSGLDVAIAEPGAAPADASWPAPAAGDAPTGLELRDGLLRGEFKLHYQPIHNFDTGDVETFEALLRWKHPRLGLLSPSSFLPAAERLGLSHALSARVLDCACYNLRHWRARGHQRLRVAVNLSAHDLRRADFAGTVASVLERHRLPPSSIELELTEHESLDDDDALAQINELARSGVALTIDDFGVKYSSLRNLHRLPVRALKVDRSFVHDVGQSAASTSIVAAVIGIAAKLGLRLVAEGVEQARQMNELRQLGCHIMQGFLFSPPVPADDVRAYLERAAPAI